MAWQLAVELVITTFSTLVKRYCSAGHVYNALRVMDEIKSLESFAPDEIMYDSLFNGCPEKQNVDEGLRLFNEMRAARIAPSNYTLIIMVKLFGLRATLYQAFQLVEEQPCFRPNVQVYTCLTQACVMRLSPEHGINGSDLSTYWTNSFSRNIPKLKCS